MADAVLFCDLTIPGTETKCKLTLIDGRLHALYDPFQHDAERLFKVLTGREEYSGSIRIHNAEVHLHSLSEALNNGIGSAEYLIDTLTLVENLKLNIPQLNYRELKKEADKFPFLSAGLPFIKKAGSLSPVDKIRLMLLISLIRRDQIILLHYPFSSLNEMETRQITAYLQRFCSNHRHVLFSADTVEDTVIASDMTCIYQGKELYSGPVTNASVDAFKAFLIAHPAYPVLKCDTLPGGVLIAAHNLWIDKKPKLEDIRLEIREGEITGILYAQEDEATNLSDCILARIKPSSGRIINNLRPVNPASSKFLQQDIRYIPPLDCMPVPDLTVSITDYVAMLRCHSNVIWNGGILKRDRAEELTAFLIRQLQLPYDPNASIACLNKNEVRALSVASELFREGPVLIAFDLFKGLTPQQTALTAGILHKDRLHRKGTLLFSKRMCTLSDSCDRIYYLRSGSLQPHSLF